MLGHSSSSLRQVALGPQYEPTDLAAFTGELASVFRAAVERTGPMLTVCCPPLDQPVFVDRDMWEKVVLNLLSSALKFTFEGEITVSLRQTGGIAELVIRDTGTGVPAAEMPRLFERFYWMENAKARTHEGRGIGLALVQELLKLHGGSITAESILGTGTTFSACAPLGSGHLPADRIRQDGPTAEMGSWVTPFADKALRWLPGDDDVRIDRPNGAQALPSSRWSPSARCTSPSGPMSSRRCPPRMSLRTASYRCETSAFPRVRICCDGSRTPGVWVWSDAMARCGERRGLRTLASAARA